jgi:hypothetical protein
METWLDRDGARFRFKHLFDFSLTRSEMSTGEGGPSDGSKLLTVVSTNQRPQCCLARAGSSKIRSCPKLGWRHAREFCPNSAPPH